jgi:hypothetical protein
MTGGPPMSLELTELTRPWWRRPPANRRDGGSREETNAPNPGPASWETSLPTDPAGSSVASQLVTIPTQLA